MRQSWKFAAFAATIVALVGCTSRRPALSSGIDAAGMDKSVAPGDDFNAYSNGGWIKATPIPPDKSSYGIDAILADETRNRTRDLIENAANAGTSAAADVRKVADFYASFMDEAAIESKGIAPLKLQLDSIAAISDKRNLARAIGSRLRADVDPLNNTNFETGNLFGVGSPRALRIRRTRILTCSRVVSGCRSANTTSLSHRTWPS